MKKSLLIIGVSALLFAGCTTGTYVVTGKARPAIFAESVKVYDEIPAGSEVIGIVNANCPHIDKGAMNRAVENLKKQAASIGANGIVITATQFDAWATGATCGAKAFFVP